MKRLLRTMTIVLVAIIVCEIWFLWLRTESVSAQTPVFLGRPYYGPAVTHTARFDHQYPLYGAEGGSYLSTLVREDGAVYSNAALATCVYHSPLNSCYSGHDARDFALSYKPVVSAAAGIVTAAGWENTDHSKGLGLRIVVDHQNNHRTIYGHLSAIRYQPTTSVGRWQIGTSGTTGGSTGPHLHFGLEFFGSGSWRDKDPYGWTGGFTDPWQIHGSGTASEWLWLPEPDRTIAAPPRNGEYYINDGAQGTSYSCLYGSYWWPVSTSAGYANDLRYTYANGTSVNCVGSWGGVSPPPAFSLPSTGLYEVEVFVPAWDIVNRTHAARYTVVFPGGQNTVVVDQASINPGEWVSLGRYTFNSGTLLTQYVYVSDSAYIGGFTDLTSRKILVDAVRVVKSH